MKKIIPVAFLTVSFFIGASSVFAQSVEPFYQYGYNQYSGNQSASSYTYTIGCTTYQYNPYTQVSTPMYTTCQNQNYTSYPYQYGSQSNYNYPYTSGYGYNTTSQNYSYYPCVNNTSYSYGYSNYNNGYNNTNCYNYSTYVPSTVVPQTSWNQYGSNYGTYGYQDPYSMYNNYGGNYGYQNQYYGNGYGYQAQYGNSSCSPYYGCTW